MGDEQGHDGHQAELGRGDAEQSMALAIPDRTPRALDPDLVHDLEAIYDELAVRAAKPAIIFNRSKDRARHELLLRRERRLLTELGFDSWASLLIGIALGEATLPRHPTARRPEVVDDLD